jgi:hypothetical protein
MLNCPYRTLLTISIATILIAQQFASTAVAVQTQTAKLPVFPSPATLFSPRDIPVVAVQPSDADTLVLCPPAFQAAIQRWTEHRTNQGHRIHVVAPGQTTYAIERQIKSAAATGKLKHIVIIGDAYDSHTPRTSLVPTHFVDSKVVVHFGVEPEIATDTPYADLDGDRVPDVSIGRIPVDTVPQLNAFIDRVIKYETQTPAGDWQRKMNLIAGVGGFGPIIDNVIEQTTKRIIEDLVPHKMQTSMTYGSWTSPYCPDPRRFSDTSIERYNEGCLFWVYIGHGNRQCLDQVHMPDAKHPILDQHSVANINCRVGSPIAVFLACYTSAFDSIQDSIAEQMLLQPGGPVATIGGSRVTMPGGMGLLSMQLMDEYFSGEAETLGDVFLNAKRRLAFSEDQFGTYRKLIETMAKTFNPRSSFKAERYEHVQTMQLLGDPLLRIKRPQPLPIETVAKTVAGQTIEVTGTAPASGDLQIELSYARDRLKKRFRARREFDPSEISFASYQATYDHARDLVCQQKTVRVEQGTFLTSFTIPAEIFGDCVIRATMTKGQQLHLGSANLTVRKPKKN